MAKNMSRFIDAWAGKLRTLFFGWESWNKWANVKQSNIAMENPPFVLPTDTLGDFNCHLISTQGFM